MGHLYQSYVKFSGGHLVTLKEILPAERNEDHFSTFLANHRDPKHVDVTGSKSGREKKTGENEGILLSRGPHCDEAFAMSYPWLWSHADGYGVGWWLHPWVAVVDPWMNFPSFPRNGQSISYEAIVRTLGPPWLGSMMNLAEIHGKS